MRPIVLVGFTALVVSPLLIGCSPASGDAQMARTIDCINNRDDQPVEICSVPEWTELNNKIEEEYAAVRVRFEGMSSTLTALERVHENYLETRMRRPNFESYIPEMEAPGKMRQWGDPQAMRDLAEDINAPERAMRAYLAFLRDIDAPREGLNGRWILPGAEIRIADRTAQIEITEGCSFSARSSQLENRAVIDDKPDAAEPPLGGWKLNADRRGALLQISEQTNDGRNAPEAQIRPYCGGAAPLRGQYFPARSSFFDWL
jgi:hypothetical protein